MSSSITAPRGHHQPSDRRAPRGHRLEVQPRDLRGQARPSDQRVLLARAFGEGLLEYVGPLVDTHVHEKPLSIALREINAGLLTSEAVEGPAQ